MKQGITAFLLASSTHSTRCQKDKKTEGNSPLGFVFCRAVDWLSLESVDKFDLILLKSSERTYVLI
jgi:hypothetical protein